MKTFTLTTILALTLAGVNAAPTDSDNTLLLHSRAFHITDNARCEIHFNNGASCAAEDHATDLKFNKIHMSPAGSSKVDELKKKALGRCQNLKEPRNLGVLTYQGCSTGSGKIVGATKVTVFNVKGCKSEKEQKGAVHQTFDINDPKGCLKPSDGWKVQSFQIHN